MAVNLGYVKSPQGILKILEIVSITEGGRGGGGGGYSYFYYNFRSHEISSGRKE